MWLLSTVPVPLQHSQACVFSESHSARACDNWLVSGHISTGPIQRLPKRTCSTLLRSSSNLSWHDVFYNALAPWIPQGVGLGCTCRISCDLMFQFLKLVAKKWIHPADFFGREVGNHNFRSNGIGRQCRFDRHFQRFPECGQDFSRYRLSAYLYIYRPSTDGGWWWMVWLSPFLSPYAHLTGSSAVLHWLSTSANFKLLKRACNRILTGNVHRLRELLVPCSISGRCLPGSRTGIGNAITGKIQHMLLHVHKIPKQRPFQASYKDKTGSS